MQIEEHEGRLDPVGVPAGKLLEQVGILRTDPEDLQLPLETAETDPLPENARQEEAQLPRREIPLEVRERTDELREQEREIGRTPERSFEATYAAEQWKELKRKERELEERRRVERVRRELDRQLVKDHERLTAETSAPHADPAPVASYLGAAAVS